ncbi:L,D-transpeptidase family protein [Konateibacter massiliensis]|uniref:L,D-transpeptidase family protein n=1 Tax=Konateibacter massiliensis TaxID=2002841 RepID=UPI0015D51677|nr:L,D-transpeptidase family protein [Konateibacter massiliensis]
MGKRRGALLTLMAITGVALVVVAIGTTKYIIKANEQRVTYEAAKVTPVFSAGVLTEKSSPISKIEPRLSREEKLVNDFATAKIQYKFGEETETVDTELIKSWITIENDAVVLDEDKVSEYVAALAKKYDTVGSERQFVNSHGETVTVSGGPYGWAMDCGAETKELIGLIKEGQSIEGREPVYKQKGFVRGINDIGNTYVEVNMNEQKMWFYKDGELIVATDIVTGNMAKGHNTPTVVGYIYNKVRNINLVGTGYVAFVRYWMKVYGSIGIHDASWRSKFGGNIYTTNGSHGCINTPYDNVKTIFENIEVGTPVIIFYDSSVMQK